VITAESSPNELSTQAAEPSSATSGALVDPRAPRFGQAITATLLLAGVAFAVAPLIYAAAVGLLAGLAATTGFCLGCRMYRQVSYLRSRGVI